MGWPAVFLLVCALAPGAAAQDPQETFTRSTLDAAAQGRDDDLAKLVQAAPERTALLVRDVLRRAHLTSEPRAAELAARVARALLAGPLRRRLVAEVARHGKLTAAERAAYRSFEHDVAAAQEHLGAGRLDDARAAARSALARAERVMDRYFAARADSLLGVIAQSSDRLAEAEDRLRRAAHAEGELLAEVEAAADLGALGNVQWQRGAVATALDSLGQAARAWRRFDSGRYLELVPRLATLLALHGDHLEAERLLAAGLALANERAAAPAAARVRQARAMLNGSLGAYDRVLEDLLAACSIWGEESSTADAGRCLVQLGGAYSELGMFAEAEAALGRAVRLFDRRTQTAEHGRARLAWGLCLLDQARHGEAMKVLEDAAEAAEVAGDPHGLARSLLQQGRSRMAASQPDAAALAFERAAKLFADLGDRFRHSLALGAWGEAAAQIGDDTTAEANCHAALEIATALGSAEAIWRARAGLGRCAERAGEVEAALEHHLAAIEEVEGLRAQLRSTALRSRFLGDKREPYTRAAVLLARAGDLDGAFAMSESAKARTLLALAGRVRASNDATPDADPLAQTDHELRLLERALTELPGGGREAAAARTELRHRRDRARAAHADARLRAELGDPRGAVLDGRGQPPELGSVRRALGKRDVLLHYTVGTDESLCLVVAPAAVRAVELECGAATLEQLVHAILEPGQRLLRGDVDVANLRFDVAAARRLHELLVRPLSLPATTRRLWLCVDGPLRALPFALLVSEHEARPVDPAVPFAQYHGCRFLVEDFELVSLPAAGLLARPAAAASPRGEMALVLADPAPVPAGTAPLRGARAEAAVVADHLGPDCTVLQGHEAGEGRCLELLPGATLVHLATHGELVAARPEYSRLLLAPDRSHDGWLHAYEIQRLRLRARLVVLSGCRTAGSAGRAEGLLGLARAFLAAGAGGVIATSWVVDDAAAAELMTAFYRSRGAEKDAAGALREAQLEVLRSGRRAGRRAAHPFFWAGYALHGLP